ncbi:MAG: hypothetical protein ACRDWA_07465 [Acidimicrobiia bacterium]
MTTDHMAAEAHDHRKRIQSHRAAKVAEYGTNSSEKDKVVVSISGAALGLTVAFVETGTGEPNLLYIAWVAFALSVIAVVISYDLNAHQLRRTIQLIDAWERDPNGRAEPANGALTFRFRGRERRTLDWINTSSVYFLVLGILATIIHIWSVS